MDISSILENYDKSQITIAALGGHSALDVCQGAKKYGFKTLVVAQRGREKTYDKYYKSRGEGDLKRGCIDEVIVVDKFSDVLNEDIQEELRKRNTIFVHNRYFWVYFDDFSKVEQNFKVPIYGTREMLKLEERDVEYNQYWILKEAGIRIPYIFETPDQIDRVSIVKVNEQTRGYERAFFFASSPEDYRKKADELLANGTISESGLEKAIIEEYVLGAQVNFNYFYSIMNKELELMGTDTRRQTNLDGLLRLPANEQLEVLKHIGSPKMVETGHMACTTKESILEKAFDIGEKFITMCDSDLVPGIGMVGPFALQGAVAAEEGREEIVIFDVSMRIPGSPGTRFTPTTGYLFGESISYGERIALEIEQAIKEDRLFEILT
jgi:5-formaminoimidazole-4-carboxamide-1-(beta)-D-ribofuranosyl 5'-monophosphate synthetase